MQEELLSSCELAPLLVDPRELLLDDGSSRWPFASEDSSNVREADSKTLAGSDDAELHYVLWAVYATTGGVSCWLYDTDVFPVPEHVGG